MNIKIYFSIILLLLININVYSQAKIVFKISEHDFGNVAEGTLASYDFIFKNTGTEPLILDNVRASCGCTTPFWTKEPILPGKEGKISASYDSKNRPGAFHKSISITSNAVESNKTIFIKGVVIPQNHVEKVFSDQEIALSPKIEVQKVIHQAGKIEQGQNIPIVIEVSNTGKSPLQILQVKSPCNCLALDPVSTKSIQPGKSERVKVIFSPQAVGTRDEVLTIQTNDITNPETKVTIQSEVVKSLSNKSILKEGSSTISF